MSKITSCLAVNLRRFRQERRLTQAQLAKKAGISLVFLQALESERKWISPTTVEVIAAALQISEAELFSAPQKKSRLARARPQLSVLIPEDISSALHHVCDHPQWTWETFRWILEGYQKRHLRDGMQRPRSSSRL